MASTTFGKIVRERRVSLGYTQSELARQVCCAPITVRKIEGDALRPSVKLVELIASALDIPEEDQTSLVHLARQASPPSPIPKPAPSPVEIGKDDLSSRSVNGFHLAEKIGSGEIGVVYRAVQPSMQRDVAIKIIKPSLASNSNFLARLDKKVKRVAQIVHPHILPVYVYERTQGLPFFTMRLMSGGNLNALLRKGPLPVSVFNRIASQVGQALKTIHAHGYLHGNLKPNNVLLDELGNAYLADFGLTSHLDSKVDVTQARNDIQFQLQINPILDQLELHSSQPSVDVRRFWQMLYQMLTGHKPVQKDASFVRVNGQMEMRS